MSVRRSSVALVSLVLLVSPVQGHAGPRIMPCPWGWTPRLYSPSYVCAGEERKRRLALQVMAENLSEDAPNDFLKSSFTGTISIGTPPQVRLLHVME